MSSALISFLASLATPRVGVVGDLMLDEYVWGRVERVSPEAPIPVLKVDRRQYRVGGAGSVVTNLARLGAEVSVFGLLGGDEPARLVASLLDAEGADLDGVVREPERKTTQKSRNVGFVQQADRAVQQILRVDDEDTTPISDDLARKILQGIVSRIGSLDAVLISDYRKGLITDSLMRGIVSAARERCPVIVDPALASDYSLYRGAHSMCPNRFEAERASGLPCRDLVDGPAAGEKLRLELGLHAVVMTLDREGILLCEADRPPRRFPTVARVVTDVTGAGDMVLSVLGLVVGGGGSLELAVELANVAAGIEVRSVGVTPVAREELLRELRYTGHPAATKVKGFEELARAVADVRREGRSVVFTNGCFDLLHLGHHHLLNGASREGDVLIVAVNSDTSVRRLKGAGRPSILQDDRVRMIAGLEAVDYVTIFDEDTPHRLLEALKPDVLVKGSEYREGVVVGRDIVESYGGRIAYVSQLPGISTTGLLGGSSGGSAGEGGR